MRAACCKSKLDAANRKACNTRGDAEELCEAIVLNLHRKTTIDLGDRRRLNGVTEALASLLCTGVKGAISTPF